MKFLAGAFVFQDNTPRTTGYASLITILAGAFVFQENTPRKKSFVFESDAGVLDWGEGCPEPFRGIGGGLP